MTQLAIKGHARLGEEIIKILSMLGGNNAFGHYGDNPSYMYYVDKSYKNHIICSRTNENNTIIFTLEEFIEKFPYKVGDKVQHKGATSCGTVYVIEHMKWTNNHIEYDIRPLYDYNHTGLVTLCADDLQPFEEEIMEEKIESFEILENHCANEVKIEFDPSKFEIVKRDDGYYVVNKKTLYPKTYKECCEVLSLGEDGRLYTAGYKASLIQEFQKLLICRDAYWKIAGDWKFDFDKECYYICNEYGSIQKFEGTIDCGAILTFPTKEMRDAFFENFKKIIEECKELL